MVQVHNDTYLNKNILSTNITCLVVVISILMTNSNGVIRCDIIASSMTSRYVNTFITMNSRIT